MIVEKDKNCRSWQGSNLRGQSPLDFKSNALTTRPQLPWRCGGSNPGPFTCKANALPLSYIPYVGNECTICRNIEEDLFGTRIYQPAKNICTHGGTRTPNLRFRRPTPYPLGHAGTYRWEGSNKVTTRANRPKMTYASPGNRTRVARMGILHDTTTPATHQLGCFSIGELF